jgi:hypothetical protein
MEGLKIVSLEDDTVETITVSHEETFGTVGCEEVMLVSINAPYI